MSNLNWTKILLQEAGDIELAEGLTIRPVQFFGNLGGPTNVVFDVLPTSFKDYDSVFTSASRAMRILRNDDSIKEVYLTLEAHNKKFFGNHPTGLNHICCQIRVELEGDGL